MEQIIQDIYQRNDPPKMNYYVSPMYLEAGIFTELICLIHILYIDSIFSI